MTKANKVRKEIAEVLKKYNVGLSIDDGGGLITGEIIFSSLDGSMTTYEVLGKIEVMSSIIDSENVLENLE